MSGYQSIKLYFLKMVLMINDFFLKHKICGIFKTIYAFCILSYFLIFLQTIHHFQNG